MGVRKLEQINKLDTGQIKSGELRIKELVARAGVKWSADEAGEADAWSGFAVEAARHWFERTAHAAQENRFWGRKEAPSYDLDRERALIKHEFQKDTEDAQSRKYHTQLQCLSQATWTLINWKGY